MGLRGTPGIADAWLQLLYRSCACSTYSRWGICLGTGDSVVSLLDAALRLAGNKCSRPQSRKVHEPTLLLSRRHLVVIP